MFNNREITAQLTNLNTVIMGSLSNTCTHFYGLFQIPLADKALATLLQAVIDHDQATVKKILDARPGLVLKAAPQKWAIESQLTWQIFDVGNENVFSIAAKRKQIKMIELMLPYYDRLPQTDAVLASKAEALSAWQGYDMQKNCPNKNEIVIPQKYAIYAQSLVDTFTRVDFPYYGDIDILNLNPDTESAMDVLFNEVLLPKNPIQLDNYLDVELLLLAVYKAYFANFNTFQDRMQRDAFCIRVIGLIQSVLPPETAKIFCESLDTASTALIVQRKAITEISISDLAKAHKLKGGQSFYRSSRDSHRGLGFQFLCGYFGESAWWGWCCKKDWGPAGIETVPHFEKTMSSKNNKFLEHYAAIAATDNPAVVNDPPSASNKVK